jgi:hypothetical protein
MDKGTDLKDDEFNFVSGMNYALNYVTKNFLANASFCIIDKEKATTLEKLTEEIGREAIEEFMDFGACEIGEIITSFLDNYPEEDEDEETD